MPHILLLILKIIGIILAVILGILVLLVCIVAFVPVRYEVKGRCGGTLETLKGMVRVTWLVHLVRVDVYYKETKLKWRLRIAWKKITGGESFANTKEKDAQVEDIDDYIDQYIQEKNYTDKNIKKDVKEDENQKDQEKNPPGESEKAPESKKTEYQKASTDQKASADEKAFKGTEKGSEEGQDESETDQDTGKIKKSVQKVIEKIKGIYHRIKCTIQGICDKIKALSEKKDRVLSFIEDEIHVAAFLKLKKEISRLLKKLKPEKLQTQAVFGFDDPANTGYALVFLSILYPFLGDHIAVRPDFEKRVLKGSLYVKGHIRVCSFVALAWNLFWCRNVRRTYRDIRNFEL